MEAATWAAKVGNIMRQSHYRLWSITECNSVQYSHTRRLCSLMTSLFFWLSSLSFLCSVSSDLLVRHHWSTVARSWYADMCINKHAMVKCRHGCLIHSMWYEQALRGELHAHTVPRATHKVRTIVSWSHIVRQHGTASTVPYKHRRDACLNRKTGECWYYVNWWSLFQHWFYSLSYVEWCVIKIHMPLITQLGGSNNRRTVWVAWQWTEQTDMIINMTILRCTW